MKNVRTITALVGAAVFVGPPVLLALIVGLVLALAGVRSGAAWSIAFVSMFWIYPIWLFFGGGLWGKWMKDRPAKWKARFLRNGLDERGRLKLQHVQLWIDPLKPDSRGYTRLEARLKMDRLAQIAVDEDLPGIDSDGLRRALKRAELEGSGNVRARMAVAATLTGGGDKLTEEVAECARTVDHAAGNVLTALGAAAQDLDGPRRAVWLDTLIGDFSETRACKEAKRFARSVDDLALHIVLAARSNEHDFETLSRRLEDAEPQSISAQIPPTAIRALLGSRFDDGPGWLQTLYRASGDSQTRAELRRILNDLDAPLDEARGAVALSGSGDAGATSIATEPQGALAQVVENQSATD